MPAEIVVGVVPGQRVSPFVDQRLHRLVFSEPPVQADDEASAEPLALTQDVPWKRASCSHDDPHAGRALFAQGLQRLSKLGPLRPLKKRPTVTDAGGSEAASTLTLFGSFDCPGVAADGFPVIVDEIFFSHLGASSEAAGQAC